MQTYSEEGRARVTKVEEPRSEHVPACVCVCVCVCTQGKIVSELLRKHVVEEMVPVMCELRHLLQVRVCTHTHTDTHTYTHTRTETELAGFSLDRLTSSAVHGPHASRSEPEMQR